MKSYEEMAKSVFSRRDEYIKRNKRLKNGIKKTAVTVICCCLVCSVTVGVFQFAEISVPGVQTEENSRNDQSSENEDDPNSNPIIVPNKIIWAEKTEKGSEDACDFGEVFYGHLLEKLIETADEDDHIGFRVEIHATNIEGFSFFLGEISEGEIEILKKMGVYESLKETVKSVNEQHRILSDIISNMKKQGYSYTDVLDSDSYSQEYSKLAALYGEYRNMFDKEIKEKTIVLNEELIDAFNNHGAFSEEYANVIKRLKEPAVLWKVWFYSRQFSDIRERNERLKELGINPCYDLDLLYDELIKLVMGVSFDNSDPVYVENTKKINMLLRQKDLYYSQKRDLLELEDKISDKECLVLLAENEKNLE